MHSRDIRVMKLLRRIAIDNVGVRGRFKLAAALAYKRDIISLGYNTMRTHPLQKKYGRNSEAIYLHAEINCISNALNHISKKDLMKCTLYVHRVKMKSSVDRVWVDGIACPCEGCQSAIEAFGIRRLIYSTDENNRYEERFV